MRKVMYVILLLLLILPVGLAANSYEIQLIVSKYVYGPAENVSMTGYLTNISSNSTANATSFVNNANLTVYLLNSTNNNTLNT